MVGGAGLRVWANVAQAPGNWRWQPPFTTGRAPHGGVSAGSDGLVDQKPIVISGRAVKRCLQKQRDAKREATSCINPALWAL